MNARPVPDREAGFTLAGLIAAVAIMLILMAMATPHWQHVMRDMREEELIFRGLQIADAVGRYQLKNGGAPPPSMEILVKGKYLRKNYKEPFAKDGRWRFIRPGEPVGVPGMPGVPGAPGAPGVPQPGPIGPSGSQSPNDKPSPSPSPEPSAGLGPSGEPLGGFIGVSSRKTEKGYRLFNGRERYSEWQFLPSPHPRVIGRPPTIVRGAAPPPNQLNPQVTLPGGNTRPQ